MSKKPSYEWLLCPLSELMDRFILATGGNLDPRAAGNRDRRALYSFLDGCLSIMGTEPDSDLELLQACKELLRQQSEQIAASK
jgi:hypothetical protein